MNQRRGSESVYERTRLDELFSALANEPRRLTLRYLEESSDGVASVDDIVAHVADQMTDRDEATLALQFHHHHLPRLVDAGLVEYDERTETVRYRDNPQLERVLRSVSEGDR